MKPAPKILPRSVAGFLADAKTKRSRCIVCANSAAVKIIDEFMRLRGSESAQPVSISVFHREYLRGDMGLDLSYDSVRRHILRCMGDQTSKKR